MLDRSVDEQQRGEEHDDLRSDPDECQGPREASTDETNIIFGATIDERLAGQMWITVVATGIGKATGRRSSTFVTASSAGSGEVLEPPSFLRDL